MGGLFGKGGFGGYGGEKTMQLAGYTGMSGGDGVGKIGIAFGSDGGWLEARCVGIWGGM